MEVEAVHVQPVGVVEGGRRVAIDDDWGSEEAHIVVDARRFTADALAGLTDFSHVDVVFSFHRVARDEEEMGARRPRGREDWPLVGIFAQRATARPNRLGEELMRGYW